MRTILIVFGVAAAIAASGCARVLKPDEVSAAGRPELERAYLKALHARDHASLVQSWSPWPSSAAYFAALRQRATELHEWDDATDERVRRAELGTGMPQSALWWSWGPPWREEVTRYPTGEVRHWTYLGYTHVTIENGTVIWWHADE